MQQKLSFTIKKVLFLVEGSVGVWLFFKQKKTSVTFFMPNLWAIFWRKITKQQQGVMVTIFGGGGLAGTVPLLALEYGSGSPRDPLNLGNLWDSLIKTQ